MRAPAGAGLRERLAMTVPTDQTPRQRVDALDLLRMIAVIGVLMFHYAYRGAAADGFTEVSLPWLAPVAKYGHFGVDMFFVISGFVIAYSAEGRSAIDFAIARFSRIYPGFLVCMTVTFAVTLAFGAPRFETSALHWLANLIVVAPALKQPFMDGAYWSIVYEITFYAWVAILIAAGVFRTRIDVIVIAWLAISLINTELQSGILKRLFLTDHSGFFVAGLLIYQSWRGRRGLVLNGLMAVAVLTAIGQALSNTQWSRDHYQVAYDNGVVLLMATLSIAAVAAAAQIRHVRLPASAVMAVGGITYPLYLLHQHIGFIVFNRLGHLASPELLIAATAIAIACLAWVVWRFVEQPGQKLAKTLLRRIADRLPGFRPAPYPTPPV
jgi:peptidoglycan/LPS O-acetylase OafA/YrhL